MAGTNPGFNAAAFRSAIQFVMDMGQPPDSDEQAVFYMPAQLYYQVDTDDAAQPFNPSVLPVTPVRPAGIQATVSVHCAVEYRDANDVPTDFGYLTPARAAITLLDVDYAKVKGCQFVVLRGEKYIYHHTENPVGLFDVGVYTLCFVAESNT